MKLIVGLGNPGSDYTNTRHNAGFMVIDRLVKNLSLGPAKSKFHARVHEASIADQACWLLEPMTFMNRSGLSVGEAVRFFKVDPDKDLMVVVDDVALPIGRIRLRAEGSSGGHNGLRDIERALGTQRYPRLRIGIDPPQFMSQVDYVLGRFSADQFEQLAPALDWACKAITCWVDQGINQAMTQFNSNP